MLGGPLEEIRVVGERDRHERGATLADGNSVQPPERMVRQTMQRVSEQVTRRRNILTTGEAHRRGRGLL